MFLPWRWFNFFPSSQYITLWKNLWKSEVNDPLAVSVAPSLSTSFVVDGGWDKIFCPLCTASQGSVWKCTQSLQHRDRKPDEGSFLVKVLKGLFCEEKFLCILIRNEWIREVPWCCYYIGDVATDAVASAKPWHYAWRTCILHLFPVHDCDVSWPEKG